MPINSFLYPGAKVVTGYNVDNSVRMDDGSSTSFDRSMTSTSTSWTFSAWVKRCRLGDGNVATTNYLISWGNSGTDATGINFTRNNTLAYYSEDSPDNIFIETDAVYRDVSAWYHVVVKCNAGAITIYVNGESVKTGTGGNPLDTSTMNIGKWVTAAYYHDGYMAEVVFVDGTALDETNFGEFDEDSGIWKPIDVSGLSVGSQGFYLNFSNSANLGEDQIGSNNFSANNLTSIDQTTDTCTNNYATYNSLANFYPADTFSNGNLTQTTSSSNYSYGVSNIGISTGKWYCEIKNSTSNTNTIGIADRESHGTSDELTTTTYGYAYYFGGQIYNNGSQIATYSSYTTGDIIGIALDLDNNKLYFSKNGTWQGSSDPSTNTGGISITAPSSNRTGFYFFASGEGNGAGSAVNEANFGNPPFSISSGNSDGNGYGNFEYSVPSGYYALNTKNLAEYG